MLKDNAYQSHFAASAIIDAREKWTSHYDRVKVCSSFLCIWYTEEEMDGLISLIIALAV